VIKTIVKLALVAVIANATWRVGSAYVTHYKFTDSVEQTTLFRGKRSDDMLRERIFEIASDYDIDIRDDKVSLRVENHHTIVEGAYTRDIELFPGFTYAWPFTFHTDTLAGIL
jgi:hypothetical protein